MIMLVIRIIMIVGVGMARAVRVVMFVLVEDDLQAAAKAISDATKRS